jgi:hypothetical protein
MERAGKKIRNSGLVQLLRLKEFFIVHIACRLLIPSPPSTTCNYDKIAKICITYTQLCVCSVLGIRLLIECVHQYHKRSAFVPSTTTQEEDDDDGSSGSSSVQKEYLI